MADLDQYTGSFIALTSAVGDLSRKMQDLEQDYLRDAKSAKESIKQMSVFKDGVFAIVKAQDNYRMALKKNAKEIAKYLKNTKEIEKIQKKLTKEVDRAVKGPYKNLKEAFKVLAESAKKAIGAMVGFASSMGVTGISLSSLAKAGMDYDRSLFQIMRSQQVAGKGSQDLGSALKYVKDNTVLAQAQFVELAQIIQNSFLGLKPSLMDTAKMMQLIAGQVGPTFETQKDAAQKLMTIQSQFPSVYDDIISSMKTLEKLRSGSGTAADKERLKIAQETLIVRMQESGMSQDMIETMLQLTTELTGEQRKQLGVLTEQQKLSKEFRDAEIAFYESLKPLLSGIMKQISSIVKVATEWKDTIITAAGALAVLRTAQIAFNIVAAMNPYVLIATAIAAAVIGVAALINKQKNANKAAAEAAKSAQFENKQKKDLINLSEEQTKAYNEEWKKIKEAGYTIEDQQKMHDGIISKLKNQKDESGKLRIEYSKISKDVQQQVEQLNKVSDALRTNISIMEEFGGINEKALQGLVSQSKVIKDEMGRKLRAAIVASVEGFSKKGIPVPIDFGADLGTQLSQMDEFLKKQAEAATNESDRRRIMSQQIALASSRKEYAEKEADISRAEYAYMERNIRLQEKFTSAYEARLDAQRRLMESAQFGLGASVAMMKQQVELSYKLMETYANANKEYEKTLKIKYGIRDADLESIRNSSTQEEAQEKINALGIKDTVIQNDLLAYAHKYQTNTKKIMDQQQKIYDLTKDIREGYLDAIREMSVGAGEFEKIIGTQEMGVTQLMGAVKDITGVAKLNTMALGGLQDRALTAKGVGTEVAGRYTAGGLQFIGGEQQEARNERIYKYGQSKSEAEAAMRGQMTGKRSTVGAATVPGAEKYLGEAREQGEMVKDGAYNGTYKGTYDAMTDALSSRELTRAMGVNIGVANKGGLPPGMENISKIQSHAANVNLRTSGYLGGTTSPAPAGNNYVYGVPQGSLPTPKAREMDPSIIKTDAFIRKTGSFIREREDASKGFFRGVKQYGESRFTKSLGAEAASARRALEMANEYGVESKNKPGIYVGGKEVLKDVATISSKRKGWTSQAEKEGLESSEAMRAAFSQTRGAMAETYGFTSGGTSLTSGTIVIKLSPELTGTIENLSGMKAEIDQASH